MYGLDPYCNNYYNKGCLIVKKLFITIRVAYCNKKTFYYNKATLIVQ